MRRAKFISLLLLAALIPIVGYAVMYVLVFALQMTDTSTFRHVMFTVILIALGLCIPYLMLKIGVHAAHLKNPREDEPGLKDISADKDDLAHKTSQRGHV